MFHADISEYSGTPSDELADGTRSWKPAYVKI